MTQRQATPFRTGLLGITGFVVGLLILAFSPTLLRQTAFDSERLALAKIRLLALQEEVMEPEQMEKEPEPPPPEPETPEPPEIEPPEIEMPEIDTPQSSYESISQDYGNTVQLPSITGLGVSGVKVAPQNFSRKLARAPMPGLPKHGPPRTRFNPDEVDRMPQAVAAAQPIYPYRAKRLGIEGRVEVRFLVDARGRTSLFKILQSQPPGEFDQVVLKTVKSWKFKPAIKDGRAVETWVKNSFVFKLE